VPDLPNYYGMTRADGGPVDYGASAPKGAREPVGMDSRKAAKILDKMGRALARMKTVKTKALKPQPRKKKK
jgi:hypothetical protein